MSEPHGRSRLGRPYRHLRRWARHTPNGEIAVIAVSLGIVLIFVAGVLALVLL